MECNTGVVQWLPEEIPVQIDQVPGLEAEQIIRLRAAGIRNCRQLLRASRRKGRLLLLCQATDLSPETLSVLVHKVELCQIRGIGPSMLGKLWQVGVRSVEELAAWEAADLQEKVRQISDRPPNLAVIEDWILQAQSCTGTRPAALSYGLPS
jgi:hypothetical protein